MRAIKSSFSFALMSIMVSAWEGHAETPKKIVSINLCTDQMAMLLAPPAELISVSFLARDPFVSALPEMAQEYDVNHGGLEEIVSLQPDLVLAHEWTSPEILLGLERFGVEVKSFSTPKRLSEIPDFVREMGEALGREPEAHQTAEDFEERYAQLQAQSMTGDTLELLTYGQNGWVSGADNILSDAVSLAGFEFTAGEYGLAAGGYMPLEVLVTAQPDIVLISDSYPGASQSDTVMHHPALQQMDTKLYQMEADSGWGCGLPMALDGVEELQNLREAMS